MRNAKTLDGVPGKTRTSNLRLRKPAISPVDLRGQEKRWSRLSDSNRRGGRLQGDCNGPLCEVGGVGTQGGIRTRKSRTAHQPLKLACRPVPPPAYRTGTGGGTRTLRNMCLRHARMPIPPPRHKLKSNGRFEWIRTTDLTVIGRLLYRAELRSEMEHGAGMRDRTADLTLGVLCRLSCRSECFMEWTVRFELTKTWFAARRLRPLGHVHESTIGRGHRYRPGSLSAPSA